MPKALLTSPTTSAVALVAAAKALLGDFYGWEPETLWLELQHRGMDVPHANREKLQAALALLTVPAFYWDGVAFEKTAVAFDHGVTNPDRLEEATAGQLAWAVKEAAMILAAHGDAVRTFNHEPGAYAAVCLHREGFVFAPAELSFAQETLDYLAPNKGSLRADVESAWKGLAKDSLSEHRFAEDAVGVQCARLAAVFVRVRDRVAQANAELASLR